MADFLAIPDWKTMFVPETRLLETFIRGTVVYVALLILLRVVLRRERGNASLTDLLVLVLLAGAAQNAMANNAEVEEAYLEGNGHLSVRTRAGESGAPRTRRQPPDDEGAI